MDWHKLKIAYLHGRPGPHWTSRAFASSINAEFHFIDEIARWHDLTLPAWKRYWRWLQNALYFPYERFDVIFLDGPHIWPPIGKLLRSIKTPLIPHMNNETLYFLYANYYHLITKRGYIYALSHYNALITSGKMQQNLARAVLGSKCPPTFRTINGVPDEKLNSISVKNSHAEPVVLLIAHGTGGWRTYYKGLDLWIEVIQRAAQQVKGLEGWIIGQWDDTEKERLLRAFPGAPVRFLGAMDDIYSVLPQASLYLHLARGEAWGVAILEAMAGGIPAIVSEWTGAAEVVEQVWPEGVVPLSAEKATEAVVRYFSLTETEKRALSEKSATLIREKYRLSQAIAGFQSAFAEALKVVGLL